MPFENTVTPKVGHADSSETTISVHWTKQSDHPGEVRIQAQRTMVEQCSPVLPSRGCDCNHVPCEHGRPGYTYDDIVNGTTPKPKAVLDCDAPAPEIWDEMPTKAQYDAATSPWVPDLFKVAPTLPKLNEPDDLTAEVLSFLADAILLLNIDQPANKNWSALDLLDMVAEMQQWEGWVTPKTVADLRQESFRAHREKRIEDHIRLQGEQDELAPYMDTPAMRGTEQAAQVIMDEPNEARVDGDAIIQSKVMDRADINRTIAALRKARDQAYGKDQ